MPRPPVWRILFVDDDPDERRQIKELLEGANYRDHGTVSVDVIGDFDGALDRLESTRVDLLILDLRVGPHEGDREEEAGLATLRAIRARCFVPVIFYTALPQKIDQEMLTRFVRLVAKTERDAQEKLIAAVIDILDSYVPHVNRALVRHLDLLQRDYMWEFVARHWEGIGASNPAELGYLLARRLALSLSGPGIGPLIESLGGLSSEVAGGGLVHPVQYYIMPPIDMPGGLTGDILRGKINGSEGYWVLLTPSCDMVEEHWKADHVLLASCLPLIDQEEYKRWVEEPDAGGAADKLRALVTNNRRGGQADRYFFLPPAMGLPALVADLQALVTIAKASFPGDLARIASLDTPFAAALAARFSRFFGRIGTPDLDVDGMLTGLRPGPAGGDAPLGPPGPAAGPRLRPK